MIKDLLTEYFSWYLKADTDDLPLTNKLDDSIPLIYEGDLDGELVHWRPALKNEIFPFQEVEEKLNIRFHETVKELLNSYWFCSLLIEYEQYEILIDPIVPGNYKKSFLTKVAGYMKAHDGALNYTPIGLEQNLGLLVVIDNATGQVCLEDFTSNHYEVIADDLYTFLKEGN